jgi:MoxR-like ATPase
VTGPAPSVAAVTSMEHLAELQRECRNGSVDPSLIQYAVRLVAATREPERLGVRDVAPYLTYGASPRATIGLVECARALAFLRGRNYALPEDMVDIAPDVLRHRLSLSYQALSEGIGSDVLIQRIMKHLPAPERALEAHVRYDNNA